ncbi:UDP-glycosyltransferase 86A1-like [Arachis duranensis]|uniref:Glycosyltransferase n=1 Tax=Arachis duranensis TaxID=130453 RepID=A0A6P4CKY7_ARADU|nr:UDP-glycosyltransferase 86A1-like [Arachis duranensis]
MATHQGPHHHALLFAYPLQGHVIPAANLAIKLASRGFVVTFVNSHYIHYQITKSNSSSSTTSYKEEKNMFAAARESGLDIRYTTVSDGLPVSHDRFGNLHQFHAAMLHVQSAHAEELVENVVKNSVPPVSCLVADTFFVWPSAIAKKFGLAYVSFWTEPALVYSLYYHSDLLAKNRHFACKDMRKDSIDYLPGVETIDPKDLTSYHQESKDTSTMFHQLISASFIDAKGADFVLCNTVQELEPTVIAALQTFKPFYAIGPIFAPGFTNTTMATSLWSESDCTQWLNSKPRGSVLYASFGSLAHMTRRVLEEIANGLLLSNVSFVWVLRPNIVGSVKVDPLPVGFRKAIRDRGMVIPWCSQTQVLAHPAIGGFLTHCGWNSILEAIWCEVPLLCFPLMSDQFTNRKQVVDYWKVGINLSDRTVITKEEVSKNVSRLMGGPLGDQLKTTGKEIKKKLEDALSPSGSSEKNMEYFIIDLNTKSHGQ